MGRIEINHELPPVAIAGRVLNEICSHALETYPEECCGLLTSRDGTRYRDVHRCRNDMTRHHQKDSETYPRDGTEAFHMNEIDYLRVVELAEARGERVTGVYHSHVGARAYFSELDQEFAASELFPFPDADHVVVSVVDREVKELGFFRRCARKGLFEGRPLRAVAS